MILTMSEVVGSLQQLLERCCQKIEQEGHLEVEAEVEEAQDLLVEVGNQILNLMAEMEIPWWFLLLKATSEQKGFLAERPLASLLQRD